MISSLKRFGSVDVIGGAVAFFSEIELDIKVRVMGFLSSIMAELQAVVLALECVSFSCLVKMCLDSQAALDACVSELRSGGPDFFLESLLLYVFDISLYALLCKSFVPIEWFKEAIQIFEDCKEAVRILVDFV
ncbi:hypothetical protein G9A89_001513 [Geosiphon pyriformis]|nr:hypothetical protein G9A89_001513 [Geosiphon pyriformis]